jgi:hypothetical protein
MNLKLFTILISALLLSGCSLVSRTKAEPEPQIITKWRTFDCGVPPARDNISFTVPVFGVTSEGFWTLTAEQYANLGDSMQNILNASGQLVAVIQFYEDCIQAAQNEE